MPLAPNEEWQVTESGIVLVGDSRAEEWVPMAHRSRKCYFLAPQYFPVCGSYDEVRERVAIKQKMDPEFRRKFHGYHIAAARIDGQIDL